MERVRQSQARWSKRITGLFILVGMGLLLSGCGLTVQQAAKTRSFGQNTAQVGAFGETEFVNIRDGIIEMNQALVVIDSSRTAGDMQFDRPTYAEPTAARVAASRALRRYGELLEKLTDEDRTDNLREVAEDLAANTAEALGDSLSDEREEAIGGVLSNVGSFWLDSRKARAIRQIVPAYQEPVEQLADLLAADLSIDDGAHGYLKAYQVTARRLGNVAGRLVNAGDRYSVLERERAVAAYTLSNQALLRSEQLDREAGKSLQQLKVANAELARLVEDSDYSTDDLKAYAKQVRSFVNLANVLAD